MKEKITEDTENALPYPPSPPYDDERWIVGDQVFEYTSKTGNSVLIEQNQKLPQGTSFKNHPQKINCLLEKDAISITFEARVNSHTATYRAIYLTEPIYALDKQNYFGTGWEQHVRTSPNDTGESLAYYSHVFVLALKISGDKEMPSQSPWINISSSRIIPGSLKIG